jgi:hypothetical protein
MTPKGHKTGYSPVLPLDELLLRELPDEGTIFAGVWPEGKTAKDLVGLLGNPQIDIAATSNRLRVMGMFGMVVAVKTVRKAANAYQITAKGKEFLASLNTKEKG